MWGRSIITFGKVYWHVPCMLMEISAFGLGRIRLVSHSSLNLFKKITNPKQQHAITCHFACLLWSQEYLVEYPDMIAGGKVCFEILLGKEMFNHWPWLTESPFIKVKNEYLTLVLKTSLDKYMIVVLVTYLYVYIHSLLKVVFKIRIWPEMS